MSRDSPGHRVETDATADDPRVASAAMRRLCILLMAGVIACARSTEPREAIPHLASPFLVISDSMVNLEVDPRWLTFEIATVSPESIDVPIAAAGIQLDSITLLGGQHYVAWLGDGHTPERAEIAARLLRAREDMLFASAVYREVGARWNPVNCPHFFVNRLWVALQDTSFWAPLLSVSATIGAPLDQRTGVDVYTFRFPRVADATPLDVAEFYRRQSFVKWAWPDSYPCVLPGCCGPGG